MRRGRPAVAPGSNASSAARLAGSTRRAVFCGVGVARQGRDEVVMRAASGRYAALASARRLRLLRSTTRGSRKIPAGVGVRSPRLLRLQCVTPRLLSVVRRASDSRPVPVAPPPSTCAQMFRPDCPVRCALVRSPTSGSARSAASRVNRTAEASLLRPAMRLGGLTPPPPTRRSRARLSSAPVHRSARHWPVRLASMLRRERSAPATGLRLSSGHCAARAGLFYSRSRRGGDRAAFASAAAWVRFQNGLAMTVRSGAQ